MTEEQALRSVYVRALNAAAEKLGSATRAVAYQANKIVFVETETFDATPGDKEGYGTYGRVKMGKIDTQMADAIRYIATQDLARFVQVSVDISPAFWDFLGQMGDLHV